MFSPILHRRLTDFPQVLTEQISIDMEIQWENVENQRHSL